MQRELKAITYNEKLLIDLWYKRNPSHDYSAEGVDRFWKTVFMVFKDYLEELSVSDNKNLVPSGWKVYKCTDCQEINVKKDNRQITAGVCDNCNHPLWNDDIDQ